MVLMTITVPTSAIFLIPVDPQKRDRGRESMCKEKKKRCNLKVPHPIFGKRDP